MKKIKFFTFLFSLAGAAIGIYISEMLDIKYSILSFLRAGIYFTIPAFLAAVGAIVSQWIIYKQGRDRVFKSCVALTAAISIAGVFCLSALMQFLYELSWIGGQNNIVLLLDVSGSMDNDNKKVNEFEAAENIVSQLGKRDKAAIIYFQDTDSVRLPMTVMTKDNKAKFIAALKEDVNIDGGATDPNIGIDAAIKMAKDAQGECAVFMISDGQGLIGEDKIAQSIKNNIVFYALDVSGFDDADTKALCVQTGGQFTASDNPSAVNDTMQSMYKSHITGNDRLLYRPRPSINTGMPIWYCPLISILFYALLGAVVSIAYMLLENRKSFSCLYNIIGGIITGCIMEINSFVLDEKFLIVPMLVVFIYPAVVFNISKNGKSPSNSKKIIISAKDEDYEPGRIIK